MGKNKKFLKEYLRVGGEIAAAGGQMAISVYPVRPEENEPYTSKFLYEGDDPFEALAAAEEFIHTEEFFDRQDATLAIREKIATEHETAEALRAIPVTMSAYDLFHMTGLSGDVHNAQFAVLQDVLANNPVEVVEQLNAVVLDRL